MHIYITKPICCIIICIDFHSGYTTKDKLSTVNSFLADTLFTMDTTVGPKHYKSLNRGYALNKGQSPWSKSVRYEVDYKIEKNL